MKDILSAITKGLGIQMNEKPKKKIMDIVDKIMEALNDCEGVKDIAAPSSSSSSSSSIDHHQANDGSRKGSGGGVVSNLREEVEANRYDRAYEILLNENNCKKGKFDALCEYLQEELGVDTGEDLKRCTKDWHESIGEYLKGVRRNEYMSLVS